jgi:Uma2 family endonuclease
VVCDASKIAPTHIEGAPEVVIEMLFPSTSAKDLRQKRALYERVGVAEYLVVDPLENYAMRFLNGVDGFDKGTVFAVDEVLVFATLDGLEVPLWEIFEVEGPAGEVESATE